MNKLKIANIFRRIARYVLLILGILVFAFALFSGAEDEPGLRGIINNSPNALPWLLLLVVVWFSWKRELLGGIIIILLAIYGAFFFGIWNDLFEFAFWLILVILICGIFFILSWKLRR
ncbi:hypothetical protein ACFLYJ_03275 [Candidatus Cloacimonadota bacterium]